LGAVGFSYTAGRRPGAAALTHHPVLSRSHNLHYRARRRAIAGKDRRQSVAVPDGDYAPV